VVAEEVDQHLWFKLAALASCRSGTTSDGASMRDVDAVNG
jgi:hypothetical protein